MRRTSPPRHRTIALCALALACLIGVVVFVVIQASRIDPGIRACLEVSRQKGGYSSADLTRWKEMFAGADDPVLATVGIEWTVYMSLTQQGMGAFSRTAQLAQECDRVTTA